MKRYFPNGFIESSLVLYGTEAKGHSLAINYGLRAKCVPTHLMYLYDIKLYAVGYTSTSKKLDEYNSEDYI